MNWIWMIYKSPNGKNVLNTSILHTAYIFIVVKFAFARTESANRKPANKDADQSEASILQRSSQWLCAYLAGYKRARA